MLDYALEPRFDNLTLAQDWVAPTCPANLALGSFEYFKALSSSSHPRGFCVVTVVASHNCAYISVSIYIKALQGRIKLSSYYTVKMVSADFAHAVDKSKTLQKEPSNDERLKV